MIPIDNDLEKLAEDIMRKTPLNYAEAMKLAVWIYCKEHPGFNDETLV